MLDYYVPNRRPSVSESQPGSHTDSPSVTRKKSINDTYLDGSNMISKMSGEHKYMEVKANSENETIEKTLALPVQCMEIKSHSDNEAKIDLESPKEAENLVPGVGLDTTGS